MELTSLGDRVLILGDHFAFSASTSDLCVGRGNCMIYRDDSFLALDDGMHVFHLDQRRISLLYDFPYYSNLIWPPPNCIGLH